MKDVEYAGSRFTTGDAIAQAVLDYATELANIGRSAALRVPALVGARHTEIDVLLGSATQLLVSRSDASGSEPESEAFTDEVRNRIEALRSLFIRSDDPSVVDWDL